MRLSYYNTKIKNIYKFYIQYLQIRSNISVLTNLSLQNLTRKTNHALCLDYEHFKYEECSVEFKLLGSKHEKI